MAGYVALENVKKIYRMGEVEILAAAGIDFEIQKGGVYRCSGSQRGGQDDSA